MWTNGGLICGFVEMTLTGLVDEWNVSILDNGMPLGISLKETERLRTEENKYMRKPSDQGLKNAVQVRRTIITQVYEKHDAWNEGEADWTMAKTIERIKGEMRAKYGRQWTLNRLYKDIKGYT